MSAVIISLPSAAARPVARTQLPRGRPPKNVLSIHRAKTIKARRQYWADRAKELEAQALDSRCMAEAVAAACMAEVTKLEIEARQARQKSR